MRKKQVFTASSLIHQFANKVPELNGCKTPLRRGTIRQVFVENDTLYSYGYHYPMAKWYGNVLLINSSGYSHTTNCHTRELERAVPENGVNKYFLVPNIENPLAEENILYLRNIIVNAMTNLLGKKEYAFLRDVTESLENHNLYAHNFGIETIKLSKQWIEILEHFSMIKGELRKKRYLARQLRCEKKREEEKLKEVENLKLWLQGENVIRYFWHLDTDFIRIKGYQVETTRGVSIPLVIAQKAYEALHQGHLKVGMKIEHYEVLKIEGDLLKIGCHNLSIKQVKECFQAKE